MRADRTAPDPCIDVLATDIPGAAPGFAFERITSIDVSDNPECL